MSYKIVKLGEICDFKGGNQPPKSNFIFEPKKGYIRFIQIRDFKSDNNFTYIPISKKNNICKNNDILIGRYGASVGKVLTGLSGAYNVALMKTIPNEKIIDKKFLYYYLISDLFQEPLKKISERSAQNGFSKDNIYNFSFPLPTLLEQRHIVTKLDAAFTEIDKTIKLEVLNITNRESILTNSLSKNFLHTSKDSKEYELGKICKIIGGGTPSKSNPKFYEGEIPWATVRDMKNDIIEETQFKINKEAIIKSSTNIIPKGNIVISTRVGLGKVCILKNDTAINQDLKGVIPFNPKIVEVNFLFYWFKAISKIIVDFGTGLTVQGVKLPFIKSLKINLPSVNEQRKIINKIQSLQFYLNNIKIIKEEKIINLKFLKNSLLKNLLNNSKET